MTDRPPPSDVWKSLEPLRERIAELERQARAITDANARHDVTNSVGAARNALILLDEGEDEGQAARFVEIARRNVEHAEAMLAPRAGEPGRRDTARETAREASRESAGDERNDLGRQGERDHRDAFGL
jgi:hypothetical protein